MFIACSLSASAQSVSSPPEYGYGTIPFGATPREVLRELSGATVNVEGGSEAQFIGYYEVLSDYYAEGLYPKCSAYGSSTSSSRACTASAMRAGKTWYLWNCISFAIYEASDDPGSYRLFLVRKTLRTEGSRSHTTVAEGLAETITDDLGVKPVIHDAKYRPFGQLFRLAARISIWELALTDIFVLVYQNILSSINADIVYRDRALWL